MPYCVLVFLTTSVVTDHPKVLAALLTSARTDSAAPLRSADGGGSVGSVSSDVTTGSSGSSVGSGVVGSCVGSLVSSETGVEVGSAGSGVAVAFDSSV